MSFDALPPPIADDPVKKNWPDAVLYIITWLEPVPGVTPFTVNDPLIIVLVFTLKPLSGDIDADTLPDDIWDRFRPTIPDAGMSNKLAPEPLNEPVIPFDTVNDPVICVLLFIDTTLPSSDMLLSFRCSIPEPLGILFAVRYISLPKSLYVSGPNIKCDDVTAPPAVPLCTNINSSCTESYRNDADTNGDDPESITAKPPNLAPGLIVLTVIRLVPILSVDSEIYVMDAEPNTVRFSLMVREPLTV